MKFCAFLRTLFDYPVMNITAYQSGFVPPEWLAGLSCDNTFGLKIQFTGTLMFSTSI